MKCTFGVGPLIEFFPLFVGTETIVKHYIVVKDCAFGFFYFLDTGVSGYVLKSLTIDACGEAVAFVGIPECAACKFSPHKFV